MDLLEALDKLAEDMLLDVNQLIEYATEDAVGGRDTAQWSNMGLHADEGKILYALVRALRPWCVVEVGVCEGCSTTHILSALQRNNHGYLFSVDIDPTAGGFVPDDLKERWILVIQDALRVQYPVNVDFVLEDGAHDYDTTRAVLQRLKNLQPRVVVSHDTLMHEIYPDGFAVKQAFEETFGPEETRLIDVAFTGLTYWINRST